MKAKPRDLIGRTIVEVAFRPFQSRPHTDPRARAHSPLITLDNGNRLFFVTEETECGEYGTKICINKIAKKRGKRA